MLQDSVVDIVRDVLVCGSVKMNKLLKGDVQWDDEVKAVIERKKKAWHDYVSCLQRNDSMKIFAN